jgi:hypothetical protein
MHETEAALFNSVTDLGRCSGQSMTKGREVLQTSALHPAVTNANDRGQTGG